MEEQVDIVDDNDNVVGQTTKQEAHEKGLLHRTVIAEVIDSSGRFMLVKQASHKQDVGQFVSPMGGHVKSGETEEEALRREVFEELGLKDFDFQFVGRCIFNRTVRERIENHLFVVYEVYCNEDPILNDEAVEFRRFTKEELKSELKNNPEIFGAAFHFLTKNLYSDLNN